MEKNLEDGWGKGGLYEARYYMVIFRDRRLEVFYIRPTEDCHLLKAGNQAVERTTFRYGKVFLRHAFRKDVANRGQRRMFQLSMCFNPRAFLFFEKQHSNHKTFVLYIYMERLVLLWKLVDVSFFYELHSFLTPFINPFFASFYVTARSAFRTFTNIIILLN